MGITKEYVYFGDDIFEDICVRIANGESVNRICNTNGYPSREAFYTWIRKSVDLEERYTIAMTLRGHTLADEALEIADDSSDDEMFVESNDESGASAKVVMNTEFVRRSELRVKTRMWAAARLAARVYGDKVTTTLQGPEGGAIPIEATSVGPDWEAILAKFDAKSKA